MVQPCIAGCCFEDPTKDPSDGSSSGGGGGGGGSTNGGDRGDSSQQTNPFSSISASSSSTSSLFASILKRNSGNSSSRNKQFLNSKISGPNYSCLVGLCNYILYSHQKKYIIFLALLREQTFQLIKNSSISTRKY